MSNPLIMVDGLNSDVPDIKASFPNNPVAYYANGWYAWSQNQVSEFGRHIAISVTGNLPEAAAQARVLDVETGDATPADVRLYMEEHARLGYSNGTVYCDLSNVRPILNAVGNFVIPRWWLAWYWNRPGVPTAAQVLNQLRTVYGVNMPEGRLWACQYATYTHWDLSVVYGKPDFSR